MASAVTYRPGPARYVAYGCCTALIVMTVVIGVALPSDITFTVADLVLLAITLGAMLALLHAIGRSRVRVSDDGIEVLNGYSRHDYDWSQVKGVAFPEGAPWPTLVRADDERIMLFAIQRASGMGGARAAVDDIARRSA